MEVKIGFEIHQQLATEQKLFCDCPTNYQDVPPNTNICPICTGMPGAKPMPPNRRAIDAAIEIALLLGCRVVTGEPIYILRKHYDYPDLPSGYQRTSMPIAKNGKLADVRIREIHIEEDPGQYNPAAGTVDFNRSGIPLVEIVTEPDIRSPEEARDFLRILTRTLEYTGKVRPEAGGAMRTDVNISIDGGGRVEIKNINSVHGAYRALKFEIIRQSEKRRRGETVERETRAYLESQMITVPMRAKEFEEDYRYIPDPDLSPLIIDEETVERIRREMPEAPHLRKERLIRQYGITEEMAETIVSERELADFFEAVAALTDPVIAGNWMRTRVRKVLNYLGMRAKDLSVRPEHMAELLEMVRSGELTPEQGEIILRRMIVRPAGPREIAGELELTPPTWDEIASIIEEVLKEEAKAVEDYRKGRKKAVDFLVGAVMKKLRGRGDAREIRRMMEERLSQ